MSKQWSNLTKFLDDTIILGLLTVNSNIRNHACGVERFVEWCDEHHLQINVKKTKEIIVDPSSRGDHTKIQISDNEIDQVTSYKYLGVHIDGEMS